MTIKLVIQDLIDEFLRGHEELLLDLLLPKFWEQVLNEDHLERLNFSCFIEVDQYILHIFIIQHEFAELAGNFAIVKLI